MSSDTEYELSSPFMRYHVQPEVAQIAKSSSPLVPEYSLEGIERFVRQTNLCSTCLIIFGLQDAWRPAGQIHGEDCFEHHPCAQSLLQSVEAGCSLCFKLRADFVRSVIGSSYRELEDEGVAALQMCGSLVFNFDRRPGRQCLWFWVRPGLKAEFAEVITLRCLALIKCKSTLFKSSRSILP